MFFYDPPGSCSPSNLCSYFNNHAELNSIIFHDQEPVHFELHAKVFKSTIQRVADLGFDEGPEKQFLITSELNNFDLLEYCKQNDLIHLYYFFHGWAALDWYRGYNHSFLMQNPHLRCITKTFISPNRIIAGKRQHRLEVLYYIFKHQLYNNWISCPAVCPAENISIIDAATPLLNKYPDIIKVFQSANLPLNFPGETGSPMDSYKLNLFQESADCLLYLITETVASGKRWHLTEKSFKPICLKMPFILVGTQGSLEYLRSYGFKTFNSIWDESYDQCNDYERISQIGLLLQELDSLTIKEKQEMFYECIPIIEHNFNHFYNGNFEQLLWKEMLNMLQSIEV